MRLPLLVALVVSTALIPVAANAQSRGAWDRDHRSERSTLVQPDRPARPAPAARATARPDVQAARERFRAERAGNPATTARTRPPVQRVDNGALRSDGRVAGSPLDRAGRGFPNRDRNGATNTQVDRAGLSDRSGRNDRNPASWQDRTRERDRVESQRRTRDAARGDWQDRNRVDWQRRTESTRRGDRNASDWRDHARDDARWQDRAGYSRNWRSDNRYNWRDYRGRNRSAFRLPRYYAPYGWDRGYRRFSIGFSLNSVLFGSNYWINDPYMYRLPPAYGPYRWVRYYNDALLVDIRTGSVVDTVYDIFW